MTSESADEHRKGIKEAVEKCSETVNRAMVSLLAVSQIGRASCRERV